MNFKLTAFGDGYTALHLAISRGSSSCCSTLLSKLQNTGLTAIESLTNNAGQTVADLAFQNNQRYMLEKLTWYGQAPQQMHDETGESLLGYMCIRDAHWLLSGACSYAKVDVNADGDKHGRTPLELAAWSESEYCMQVLLQQGAQWKPVLTKAAKGGQYKLVRFLLGEQKPRQVAGEIRLELDEVTLWECWTGAVQQDFVLVCTSLLAATERMQTDVSTATKAKLINSTVQAKAGKSLALLASKAWFSATANSIPEAFEIAIADGNRRDLTVLFENSVPADGVMREARILHAAIRSRNLATVRLTLRYGFDLREKWNEMAPLQVARAHGTPEIVALLKDKGAVEEESEVKAEVAKPGVQLASRPVKRRRVSFFPFKFGRRT